VKEKKRKINEEKKQDEENKGIRKTKRGLMEQEERNMKYK
jgi:hypothetical protein